MSIGLGTHITSSIIRNLHSSSSRLSSVYERLSSGQRINKASDDAAGLAVASGLNFKRAVFNKALENLNTGISALSIANQGLDSLSIIVMRQQELAEQAANGTLSSTQRAALDLEAQALADEYQRIIETTSFNGIDLLQGTASISLQAGVGEGATISAELLGMIQSGEIGPSNFSVDTGGTSSSAVSFMYADLNGNGINDLITFQFKLGTSGGGASDLNDRYLMISVYMGNEEGELTLHSTQGIDVPAPGPGHTHSFNVNYVGDTFFFTLTSTESFPNFDQVTEQWSMTHVDGTLNQEQVSFHIEAPTHAQSSVSFDFTGNGHIDNFNNDGIASTFTATLQLEQQVDVVQSLTQNGFSLTTAEGALAALDYLSELLDTLSSIKSIVGASESRINAAASVIDASRTELSAAEGRIKDADIAQETAAMVRETTLQQAGAALLGLSNTNQELALLLLEGI